MKLFIYKLILFVLLYLVIRQAIIYLVPYYWGNSCYLSKIKYLKESNLKPNVVFFGSSRIYRQVNPNLYDSIYFAHNKTKIESFNFGTPGNFPPQTYYLLNNFIESEIAQNCKLIFLELSNFINIDKVSLTQERVYYWTNLNFLILIIKSTIKRKDLSVDGKIEIIKNYINVFLKKVLGIGLFYDALKKENLYDELFLGPDKNGYVSLDYEFLKTSSEDLANRKKSLDILDLERRLKYASSRKEELNEIVDRVHLQYLYKMIENASKHGIKLIFILPPRNSSQILSNLANALPKNSVVDLSKNKDFYTLENSFDNGHLNSKGANLFTYKLFELYSQQN